MQSLSSAVFLLICVLCFVTNSIFSSEMEKHQITSIDDIKKLYFDNVTNTPKQLDERFDKNFFAKNPVNITLKGSKNSYYESYPKTVKSFVCHWDMNDTISLLEGLVIYIYNGNPDFCIWIKKKLPNTYVGSDTDVNPSIDANSDIKRCMMSIIGMLLANQVHNPDFTDGELCDKSSNAKKWIPTVPSQFLGKIIADTYDSIQDDSLKCIVAYRKDAISMYRKEYGVYCTLTECQLSRLKKVGFEIE